MNYGGQDQRYNGGQGLTDGYGEYEGEKNYYGQQGPSGQQLPSFPFSSLRNSQQQQQAAHPYHGGLHQPSPNNLLGERVLPPMSSVARGQQSMPAGSDLGVNALSAAAAAHQMSRLGEAFKDSLAHQMGPSSKAGGLGPSPYGVSLPQQQYGMPSTSSHSDRLYGGSANPFPGHTSAGSGMGGALTEKSSPRSSTQRGSSDNGYGLPTSTRGSGDRGIQLPAPSMASQLGNGAAHQAAVSLSHIAGGGGANSQLHSSSNSVPQQQQPVRTAASMNPKDLLELYSKWDQIDTKSKKNKNEEAQAEEVRKERHNMAEKRRRSDMNGAIDRLKTLLPQQVTNDRRLTKVEVLTEAADHLTQVQNLCAKLITENKRLKLMVPGIKLEDDEAFLTRDDDAVEDNYASERRSSGDEDGGEGGENPAKRQRRNSPGDNSDSNGSGREGEGNEGGHGGKGSSSSSNNNNNYNGHSSSGSQSGSGEDERDEIVIDQRGETDDDDDAEGRDSDNSNDGLTGKQRMAIGNGDVSADGEPTSFSGLSFPQSDMSQPPQQPPPPPQQQHHFQHHHGGAGGLQQLHQQQLHLHHQHGGL